MRLALSMALVLLSPLLARAEVPRDHFPGIVLDEPIPAAFETGRALLLSGSVEDDDISYVRFSFRGADDLELDFWCWVVDGRFEREAVFPHSVAGPFDLVVHAQDDDGTESLLGRFDGLQMDQGAGAVALPRRYFPLVHLDQPLSTRLTTGEALHVAGTLEGYQSPARHPPAVRVRGGVVLVLLLPRRGRAVRAHPPPAAGSGGGFLPPPVRRPAGRGTGRPGCLHLLRGSGAGPSPSRSPDGSSAAWSSTSPCRGDGRCSGR